MNTAIIICGPTASGKSDFAHNIARKYNGEIINCDSMQIYQQIPIITASPSASLKTELPYHLYNFLDIDQEFSVVKYVEVATEKIKEITNRGKLAIIVGGSGLYINALLFGYSKIPAISDKMREYTRNLQQQLGQQEFFNQLQAIDHLAIRLNAMDKQRTARAYEVFKQTGQSIFDFQAGKNIIPLPEFSFKKIALCPDRDFLYSVCNERLIKIFNEGAIEEVKFIKENFGSKLITSAIKALGVQEIMAYLDNYITIDEAITLAQAKTRQYAKRQTTWFKHQLKADFFLKYSNYQEFLEQSQIFLKSL